ncbi:MAG: CidA/LrgA family protein [Cellvibrionaceae bacterium]
MKFLNGLTLLLIFQLAGEFLSLILKLPIPGPVIGMLLLFVSLFFINKGKEALNQSSSAILSHLSLLFIPAGVGLMIHFDRVGNEWLPISLAIVLGAIISMVSTAWIMVAMIKLSNALKRKGNQSL